MSPVMRLYSQHGRLSLISCFKGTANIEDKTATELTKLGAVVQVPLKAGVYYNIRGKTIRFECAALEKAAFRDQDAHQKCSK